jgi:hypothetical protein
MRPVDGKYGGRLVFCAVRNAYEGDVPVWSDDGGKSYNYSTGVYLPGTILSLARDLARLRRAYFRVD